MTDDNQRLIEEAEKILSNCSEHIENVDAEELRFVTKMVLEVKDAIVKTQFKILAQDWPEPDIQANLLMSLLLMLVETMRLIEAYQKMAYGLTDKDLMKILVMADRAIEGKESIISKMAKKYMEE